jgi:hypothetical protein
MTSRSSSNVVPFGLPDSAQTPRQGTGSERLLAVCRDRLAHAVATAFAGNLGAASDDLLGMADRAISLEQQQLHFAALELLSNRSQALLEHFRSAYVAQFDVAMGSLRGGQRREPTHREDVSELSLVATDDFERDLAIGKLSARAACNCAQQLISLDRQLAALLRLPRIVQDDNPLYPRAIFTALLRALSDMGESDHLALLLLQEFERQTSAELPGIYNDLNRHLADSGVLPQLPVGSFRPAPRSAPLDAALTDPGVTESAKTMPPLALGPAQGPAPAALSPNAPDQARYADPQGGGDNVFAELARVIQTAAAAQLTQSAAPMPMQPSMPIPGGLESGSTLGLSRLIEALTSLQRGGTDPRSVPGLGSVRIEPERGNVLKQIRSTPLASGSAPVDVLTIDIVAMLFDAIFNDPDLPATLRAEIAKLQIPVLKVALMDRAFFSNKRHPARRLLDAIASSGIGRNDVDEPRLTAKIHTIVEEVVGGFETDINIFTTQVAKLEEFLADEESRAHSRTTRVVDKLAEQDRQQLAQVRAAGEIESRVRGGSVPALVADFLTRHWRQVLVSAFVRGGEQDSHWVDAVGTMEDLVWSVTPKQAAEERNRLLTTLPDLLKRLRVGLESVDLNDAWDPFFAQLIRIHFAALHNEIPDEKSAARSAKDERASVPLVPPEDQPVLPLKTSGLLDVPAGIEFRSQEPGVNQRVTPEDQHWELARSLEVGTWVEFESLRGTRKTLRVSWISDLRGVFLFTNRQGENALTLTTTSLAEHLRQGRARVLSRVRLTDRAVARLLEKTRAEHADR